MRKSDPDHPWPKLGYAHIKGYAEKKGNSRVNQLEAGTIVNWIKKNQQALLEHYPGKSLNEIVGIITPFVPQTSCLKKLLKEENISLNHVGTVHTLQGAEKPIIIFSPVYSYGKDDNFFFDKNVSMLNVAVSRAKDSFLVFSDMDIFDPTDMMKPSGLLAQYLFDDPTNEIKNIPYALRVPEKEKANVRLINTRSDHQELLLNSFLMAKEELVIVSPFLSIHAITDLNIEDYRKRSTVKKIIVYTDLFFNKVNRFSTEDTLKDNAQKAIQTLSNLAIDVRLVKQVHSKLIFIDEKILVEGSYNWLSAPIKRKFSFC